MNYCEACGQHTDEAIEAQDNESLETVELCKKCYTLGMMVYPPRYVLI